MSVGDGKSARASRNSRRLPRVPEILPFTEGLLILGILLAVCGIFPDGRRRQGRLSWRKRGARQPRTNRK